jgi:5-methylcytosine-specific restriction endonuclease McrA
MRSSEGERPMLLHTGRFIADTVHMDAVETGALGLLMMAAWKRPLRTLPDDDRLLAKIARVSVARWRKRKAIILAGWRLSEGQWFMDTRFIDNPRPSIPPSVRASVLGEQRCIYCDATEGPFEVDHVYPHSRGGPSIASNLACACKTCNRAKRDSTLEEWLS